MTKPENETIKKQEKEDNESNNFLTKKKFTEMILESVKSDMVTLMLLSIYAKRIILR